MNLTEPYALCRSHGAIVEAMGSAAEFSSHHFNATASQEIRIHVEPHDFSILLRSNFGCEGRTAVVLFVSSVEPAESCPPSPRLRRTPAAHSSTASSTLRSNLLRSTGSRGFLRRRVKTCGKGFPNCRVLRELSSKNILDRLHRDPNRRGQLLFGRSLTELSMNKAL